MPRGVAAKRHAQAAFHIALERGELERWRSDLKAIAATLSDPQLMAVLESPKVHSSEKMELVKRCLPGVGELVLNLVYLLVARRRLGLLPDICAEYEHLTDAHQGVRHAEVTAAIPLDEEDKERLSASLSALTGEQILLSTKVDPELIGGFVARIGDWLIDGSIRNKLDSLREEMKRG
jgi:F-type H+-transporting ATPase subunit delta